MENKIEFFEKYHSLIYEIYHVFKNELINISKEAKVSHNSPEIWTEKLNTLVYQFCEKLQKDGYYNALKIETLNKIVSEAIRYV